LLLSSVVLYSLLVFSGLSEEFSLTAAVVRFLVSRVTIDVSKSRDKLPLGLDVRFRDGSEIVEGVCVLRVTDEGVDLFASTLFGLSLAKETI
jgi:hypothetical protein